MGGEQRPNHENRKRGGDGRGAEAQPRMNKPVGTTSQYESSASAHKG